MNGKKPYHSASDEVLRQLGSSADAGLSASEANARLQKFGPNQLQEKKPTSPLRIFLAQFEDFIIWVLIGAALVSGFLREWVDAWAIVAIVIINAILGFVQEYRAERSLLALRKLSSPSTKVFRDGRKEIVPSRDLVPGDVIELEAGDHVPADARLIWLSAAFGVQEASLTGESTPVTKNAGVIESEEVALADRVNMVYMGTSVTAGKAKAVITDTGMQTELGKIAGMIQGIEKETTPLQKKLEEFGKWIVYACFGLVGLVFLLEWLRGGKLVEVFLTAVSLAVAAIPEGLPAVVTIALALGVQRMVKRHALIRKLPSVETLGCTTVICSDKTGTLTKNEMTVQAVYCPDGLYSVSGIGYDPRGEFSSGSRPVDPRANSQLMTALRCAVLCNGAQLVDNNNTYSIVGDPTEGALLAVAAKAGIIKAQVEKEAPFVEEIPFDSERKKMTMIRNENGSCIAYVKGAPDVLLHNCSHITTKNGVEPIRADQRAKILEVNESLAKQAMRVLAVAYRKCDAGLQSYDAPSVETGLVFAGLLAMIDPPRQEVKEAIKACAAAGIRSVMITGDHKNTAVAVGRELGIVSGALRALSGDELDKLSDEQLRKDIASIAVYARVSPEHKLRIVRAWRSRGDVVAMTGDGVNDAPAVKEADIGVAMGITGTDVTKEVSDMVVTDDNFASIVAAVEEGRGIYDNIKKFVHYLLSCNTGEILVMFIATLIGLPVPLLPIQILWINLVTDGLPALALGVDAVAPDIMKRGARRHNEAVISGRRAGIMIIQGACIALCSLAAFMYILFIEKSGVARARTGAFIVLACAQLFHSFNCRNMSRSLFEIGIFTNTKLILATAVSFSLQMAVVYVPVLRLIFKTEPLGFLDWLLTLCLASFPFWAMEAAKRLRNVQAYLKDA